jgi:hypothetical protein
MKYVKKYPHNIRNIIPNLSRKILTFVSSQQNSKVYLKNMLPNLSES